MPGLLCSATRLCSDKTEGERPFRRSGRTYFGGVGDGCDARPLERAGVFSAFSFFSGGGAGGCRLRLVTRRSPSGTSVGGARLRGMFHDLQTLSLKPPVTMTQVFRRCRSPALTWTGFSWASCWRQNAGAREIEDGMREVCLTRTLSRRCATSMSISEACYLKVQCCGSYIFRDVPPMGEGGH